MYRLGAWVLSAYLVLLISGCGGGDGSNTATVSVPTLAALTQRAAETAITGAGLTVGTVTMQSSSTITVGSVVSQSPVAGTNVASGSAVNLVVSTGPAQVAVPNVLGQTQAAATAAITGAGLTVGNVTMQPSSTVAVGSIISENPVAGTNVAGGSAVNLVVSTGPAQVAVPNVVGQTQAAATTAITGAGLTIGTVTQGSSSTVPAGSVISESPIAGTFVSSGTAVNLVISSTFTALTSTMVVGRAHHSATLLPNGKVLIAGGFSSNILGGPALNTAELYDPAADTFTALTALMRLTRTSHTATLLPSGQVLLAGGQTDNNNGDGTSTAELYDPVANTFTALTAKLSTPRGGHTATLLPNGKVLLAGGYNNSSVSLSSAEAYDPVAQTFTALTATMTSPRSEHAATLLPNGKTLLTGGGSSHTTVNTAEVYDPTANTFTAVTATMTSTRAGHTSSLLPSGLVLLTGGGTVLSFTASVLLNTAELYDPVANTFTSIAAAMTTARAIHTATLLPNGSLLLTGGGNTVVSPGPFVVLNTAEVFKALPPPANTFTPLTATMASVRGLHTATLLPNGKVVLTGGIKDITLAAINTAELYDPEAQTFTALGATMTSVRVSHTATKLPNGLVLITGGGTIGGHRGSAFSTAELYNPTAQTFTALAGTMSIARVAHTATLLPNGKVLLTGGFSSLASLNTAELYDPVANTFKAVTATMTSVRAFHTATLLSSGRVLFTGGSNNGGGFSTAELYDPVANTFTAVTATMASARAAHTATLLPNGHVLLTGGCGALDNCDLSVSISPLNSAEEYDPVAQTFVAVTATLSAPRGGHTATLLPNGQVLLAGGGNGAVTPVTVLNTAELYAP